MVKTRVIGRDDASRLVATRDHRRSPQGWTAVEAADLAGIPKRTVQEWRKTGFFLSALPDYATGHPAGELYCLSDVVTLRVMRLLLDGGVDRKLVALVGEVFPLSGDDNEWFLYREWGEIDPPLWCSLPASYEDVGLVLSHLEDDEDDDIRRFHTRAEIEARFGSELGLEERSGLLWSPEADDPIIVFVPICEIAAEISAAADTWRRLRRIPPKRWPAWM